VTIAKTGVFQAYPKEVGQNEKQQMLYVGNILYPSVYPTLKTKTIFETPNDEVTSSLTDLSISGNKLTFGPSNDKVAPLSSKEVRIHYTNNGRFLVTEKLVRTLEVSHWGNNLAYEEFYDVIHGGAKLKGYYSRLDFDREMYRHHETAVIKQFSFELPPDTTDVYYRDIIGNVSTSNFRSSPFEKSSLLELRPRFPLYGGWKTSWYHGYNTLLSNSLEVGSDGSFVLNFDFVAPYEDAVIEEFILRVTLPEGADDIRFEPGFDLDYEQSTEKIQTYLDTIGRPVVVIKKKNVVNEHQVPVKIIYRYRTVLMLQEPLLLIAFYFFLFVCSIILVRLDLRILTPEVLKKDKLAEYWYDLVEREEMKRNIFKRLQDSTSKFEERAKNLEADLDKRIKEVKAIQTKVAEIDTGIAAQIGKFNDDTKVRFDELVKAYKGYHEANKDLNSANLPAAALKKKEDILAEKERYLNNCLDTQQKEDAAIDEILRRYL
jgi:oligosaccharyltransferase complex subunit alpha (ribophorin I)